MKIQLKRSNVLNGGVAKEPTASQMEYGELAVNYNAADPAIFLEDDTGAIIRIAGKGSISSGDVPSGGTPPNSGNQVGDLFFDTTLNQLLYWDGTEWKPVSSALNDLTDVIITNPAQDELLVYNGSEWVNADPGYLTEAEVINILEGNNPDGTDKPGAEEYAKLSDIKDGKLTIKDADDNVLGEFTANQEGDTEITLPEPPISGGDTEPNNPNHGDLWVDTSECPPVLKIYVDEAECPGEGGWQEIEGGTPKPIEPDPGDGNSNITPTPPGSGTELDPFILTAKVVNYGGSVATDETIAFSNQKPGAPVQFVDQNTASNGTRYTQPVGVIGADGTWSGKLIFSDTPDSIVDTDYTGLLKIGSSSIYYSWQVTSEAAVIPPPVITQNPFIESENKFTNEPITVARNAIVTNATKASETWVKDGVDLNVGGNSYTPTEEGKYSFKEVFTGNDSSTVTATSNVLTIEEEVDPNEDLTKPTAEMYGLRFDSPRTTYLRGPRKSTSTKLTYSFWFKYTGEDIAAITFGEQAADKDAYIYIRSDGVEFGLSGVVALKGGTITPNIWMHVVAHYEVDKQEIFLNGESVATGTAFEPEIAGDDFLIGVNRSLQGFSGYLSDVYLVEQILPPETFGRSFSGKWGPRDSQYVLEDIKGGTKSPYDQRPNMDEKWSDKVETLGYQEFYGGGSAEKVFDGDTVGENDNQTTADAPVSLTNCIKFTPDDPFENVTSLRVFGGGNLDPRAKPSLWINDDVNNKVSIINPSEWKTIPLNGSTTINSISWGIELLTVGMNIRAIEINGRILVDGPADNSQNWSDYVSSTSDFIDPAVNMFDGNVDTYTEPEGPGTATFSAPSQQTGDLRIKIKCGTRDSVPSGNFDLKLDNVSVFDDSTFPSNGNSWVDFGNQTWTTLTFGSNAGNNWIAIAAIEVDGKVLVDSGAQWDTSQVWSDFLSGKTRDDELYTRMFDGDITTAIEPAGSVDPLVWDIGQDNAIQGQVEVILTGGAGTGWLTVNGVANNLDGTTREWQTLTGVTELYSFQITSPGGNNPNPNGRISAWRVGGKILVDAGTLGENGFFLPFNPAADATGAPYSNALTASAGWFVGQENTKAFDGNEKTGATIDGFLGTVTFAPIDSITISSSFEWRLTSYSGTGGLEESTLTLDGVTVNIGAQGSTGYLKIPEFVGKTINATTPLVMENKFAVGRAYFWGLKIDGIELVEYNSIGADASGNANHFQDKNFAVGNTSEVWSNGTASANWNPGIKYLFNGDVNNGASTPQNNTATYTFANPITANTSIAAYCGNGSGSGSNQPSTRLQLIVDGQTEDINGTPGLIDTGLTGVFSGFNLIVGNSSGSVDLRYLVIDGEQLVDPNAQDTVVDTPMKAYAVLESGSNGNLIAPANQTHVFFTQQPTSGTYYFEVTVANIGSDTNNSSFVRFICERGVAGMRIDGNYYHSALDSGPGVTTTSHGDVFGNVFTPDTKDWDVFQNGVLAGKFRLDSKIQKAGCEVYSGDTAVLIYNFGQQPFVYGEHDLDAGTVVIDGVTYNTLYQTWQEYARTALGYAVDRIAELEQQRTIDLATIESLRVQVEQALARISAIESDEINDDAVDTTLLANVADLLTRVQALENPGY